MAETYVLTHDEAKLRSHTLEGISYEISLALTRDHGFSGIVKIHFTCKNPANRVFLDFHGKLIDSVKVNGQIVETIYKNSKIELSHVNEGLNSAEIEYQNDYSNDGLGLHHYIDPEDTEFYCYSQCEPYSANRIFPCFDQPDLKATHKLSVAAPSVWKVIGNEKLENRIALPKLPGSTASQTLHVFNTTPRMSTYLFAVCSGPYDEYRHDTNELNLELGLFCRKTLSKYMNPEIYFRWSIEGFKYYNSFFGYTYPFSKYDQLFVPEFKFGAMENIGCVTYRDQFLFKDPPSKLMLSRVCEVFLHEMAHMWFGNLVTMKWWEDLWLNESFATFMSFLAKEDKLLHEHPTVWIEFLSKKGWGYATDQLSTTHPISTPVENTNQTESNFDGISYSKGSSVLKQLYFIVGKETFSKSLQLYMHKYQYSNAEFDDFIQVIAEQARESGNPIDINHWANIWVKTAGLNELEPVIHKDENGKVTSLVIKQTAALTDHTTLRDHKIIVELFDSSMNSIQKSTITVQPQAETVFDQFNGLPVACAILNVDDWGYCKIRIDESSFEVLKDHLSKINEPLTRQLVYRALWDMVRDIKMSAVELIEFVLAQLSHEKDTDIASIVLDTASAALTYIPIGPHKENLMHQLFELSIEKLARSTSDSEAISFKNKASGFIYHPEDVQRAVQWLATNQPDVPNWKLGQQDRWTILKRHAEISTDAQELVTEERKRDPSDTGHIAALYCEAAYPNAESKHAIWERIVNQGQELSNYDREAVMHGFNRPRQGDLINWFADLYFEKVPEILANTEKEFAKVFCSYLLPAFEREETIIERIEKLIPHVPSDRLDVLRNYRESIDELTKHKAGKELSIRYLNSKS